jgi:hypothetical protein
MRFEVYCDEANPDVLTSANPRARHLMIGSLWLPEELRNEIKSRVGALRERHQAWGEIKWSKVSPNRRDFFVELIDLFFAYGDNLRFRCIAVDRTQLNLALHDNDGKLGFYKFYYQLLHHWILDFNAYRIFCDVKSNRDPKRLPVLARCLARANLTSSIDGIQSLPSHEVVLIQLCDLLLGAASSRINDTLRDGTAKAAVVQRLESALGRPFAPTHKEAGWFAESQLRALLPNRQQHREDQKFAGMVAGGVPPLAGRRLVMAARKKQKPLICYAGSAAETSIGPKPIGSELNARAYPKRHFCKAGWIMAQSRAYLPDLGHRHGRYARAVPINQRLASTTSGSTGSIAAEPNPQP